MALTDKLTAIAEAIRSKTGKSDALTLEQMPGEIEGIQTGGGSGSSFGELTARPNLINMFYALENGTGVTGEFTLASLLTNAETLIFDTGLDKITGFLCIDTDYDIDNYQGEYSIICGWVKLNDTKEWILCTQSNVYQDKKNYVSNAAPFTRINSWRVDGGSVYATAFYSQLNSYKPFEKGHRYKWVAW